MGSHDTDATTLGRMKQLLARSQNAPERAADLPDDLDIVTGLGLDSLQLLEFLLAVELAFGIVLDFEQLDVADLGTIRDFSARVAALQERRQGERE